MDPVQLAAVHGDLVVDEIALRDVSMQLLHNQVRNLPFL